MTAPAAEPRTLSEKIWDAHVIDSPLADAARREALGAEADAGTPAELLYIDLHLVHEVTSPQAFEGLRLSGRQVRRPDLTLATVDHNVPTIGRDQPNPDPLSATQIQVMSDNCREFGLPLYGIFDARQGIVHVIGPEQGVTQPGLTIVCGDSHTSTHGAFGALAVGIGTSEVEHVLATQTLRQSRPRTMSVEVSGALGPGVTAKDVILAIINEIGVDGGVGYVIEYRGEVIRSLSMEGRMTVCNMSIEAGARAGLVAPDETTFEYVKGRPQAPQGEDWEQAVEYWRTLPTDEGARFDREVVLDGAAIEPFVTWGTNPGQSVAIGDVVPDPVELQRAGPPGGGDPRAGVHGPRGGHADPRDRDRPRLPRLLHERAHRRPARRGEHHRGQAGRLQRARDGGAGLRPREGAGRARGPRRDLHGGGLRVARRRLLDVPRHEPGHPAAGRALRLHLQPQLRGPAGAGRTHAPRESADGGGGGDRRPLRRCEGARLMDPVTRVTGNAIPLNRANVDTDQIIPAKYLKRIERTGYGPFAFESWRADPDFVLNDPAYEGAPILIAQQNLGSGSSREHAVWAIQGLGVRALIAPTFADIFKNNCFQGGVLTVELAQEDVDWLMARAEETPAAEIEVDLETQTVRAGAGWERTFEIDAFRKYRLLRGLDDIAMTLEYEADVERFEQARPSLLPTVSAD